MGCGGCQAFTTTHLHKGAGLHAIRCRVTIEQHPCMIKAASQEMPYARGACSRREVVEAVFRSLLANEVGACLRLGPPPAAECRDVPTASSCPARTARWARLPRPTCHRLLAPPLCLPVIHRLCMIRFDFNTAKTSAS